MSTLVPFAIAVFVLVQVAIGYWASRRIAKQDDFLVAGRRLGFLIAGVSIFATWFGAESVIGASAAIREEGLAGGRADPIGYAISLVLLGLILAARLWKSGAMTLADAYRQRYGVATERVAAIVMIPPSLLWCAAQIRAFGQILSFETPLSIELAIALATVLAITYTCLGGLLGDVLTDVVQGAFILIGVLVMLFALVNHFGGWDASLGHITREQLVLVADGESWLARFDIWLIPLIGALVAQESISRTLGCRDAKGASRSALLGGGMYLAFGAAPVLLGLLGAHYALELTDSEAFIPVLSRELLPPVLYVIFTGAMVSAILSTVDSALLSVGSIVARNLVPGGHSTAQNGKNVLWARLAIIASGVVCCVVALSADGIYDLVLQADALGTAGIAVVLFAALFTKFGGPLAAITTLVVGVVSASAGKYILGLEAPFLTSLLICTATYAILGGVEHCRHHRPSRA